MVADSTELVNMAAEGRVLLFNVNYCVFVKEKLVWKSLKGKKKANSRTLLFGHCWRRVLPHPRAHWDLLSAAAGRSGCRGVGYEPAPLAQRHQSAPLLEGPVRPRIQACEKSAKCEINNLPTSVCHAAINGDDINLGYPSIARAKSTSWSGSSSSCWNLLFTVRPDEVMVACWLGCSRRRTERIRSTQKTREKQICN